MNDDRNKKDSIPDDSGQPKDYKPLSKKDKEELINQNDDRNKKDFIPDGSGQLIDYEPLSKKDREELINQEEINERKSDLSPEKFKESRSVLLGVEKRTYIKWRENQKIRPRQLARIESGLKKEYKHLALQYVRNPAALIELIKETSHFMFEAVWETPLDRIIN